MGQNLDILIVHDDPVEAERLLQELAKQNVPCDSRCVQEAELVEALEQNLPDLVLFDSCHGCSETRGFAALDLTQHRWPNLPFVFVCRSCDPKVELEVSASGAACVYRGHLSDVASAIEQALEESHRAVTAGTDSPSEEDVHLIHTHTHPAALAEPLLAFPFCVRCRQLEPSAGHWEDLVEYLEHHERVTLIHALCPACAADRNS